ncbi:KTSC domain containing protein [uncultured Caudovirales phage]|uniref:KTSC domain containing protein n=1 Tax=uncultured Caudovirales phage TaxID=2100421 RepID=A0A6J5QC13_9CAUD|nr:KTSC domain containing protein [uncultured Caudovirales phage]CAB4179926.1 KTSC domain containing protein [uncultured Caudovirales phage]CAB4188775.1 KTSC domain containing protein [uncultured Caudovirales phage]
MGKRDLNSIMNARLDDAIATNKSRPSTVTDSWAVSIPTELSGVGAEVYAANTQNPKRPRAYTIGYNHTTNTVIIVMRSGAWWQYNNVSVDVWSGLKSSASTNDYLPTLEAACSSHHAADLDALSAGVKDRFSHSAATASRIQKGRVALPTLDDTLFNRG